MLHLRSVTITHKLCSEATSAKQYVGDNGTEIARVHGSLFNTPATTSPVMNKATIQRVN